VQSNPETPNQLPYRDYWRSLQQTWSNFRYLEATEQSPETLLARYLPHLAPFELPRFDVDICAVGDRSAQIQAVVLGLGANLQQVRSEKFYAF